MFASPPAGLVFTNAQDLLPAAQRVLNSLRTGYMPLANRTGMTDAERAGLIDWLEANR